MKNIRQTIVVRKDLKNSLGEPISVGKISSQVAHASLGVILKHFIPYNKGLLLFILAMLFNPIILIWYVILNHPLIYWITNDFTKIVLTCKNEKELLTIEKECINRRLKSCVVYDSGKTEFNNIITPTCIGIGPDHKDLIDIVTKKLQSLKGAYYV